jgi:uncharacterized protein HemX
VISPVTKVLAVLVLLLAAAAAGTGYLLKKQIGETAVAEAAAKDNETKLIALTDNMATWNKTLAAVDEKLGKLRGNAWQQKQALDKILGDVANENPDWARARLPADYIAGLCNLGLVAPAAAAELCADPGPPAR